MALEWAARWCLHQQPLKQRAIAMADALSKCPEFTSTDPEGVATKMKVKPLSMANFGDRSLAMAIEAESDGMNFGMNMLFIVIGHNTMALANVGLGGADGSQLEPVAQAAIQRLEATAKG